MMSKAPRWPDNQGNSHSNKPAPKTGGKEAAAALAAGVSAAAKQGGNASTKSRVSRSNSLSSRGVDSSARAGGSLKRSGQQSLVGQLGGRAAPRSERPALRLCGSRSFSSLHTSSLTAAPFIRGSRSLSRLDQRSSRDTPSSHSAEKGETAENTALSSGQQIRANTDRRDRDDAEKMKTCSSEAAQAFSPQVSSSKGHHHCYKVKKQSRDGVYTLCAMTSGMRRNLVQAVLKNVRPGPPPDVTSAPSEPQPPSCLSDALKETDHTDGGSENSADETQKQQKDRELSLQSPADENSALPTMASSHFFRPISPPASPTLSPIRSGGGASCYYGATQTGVTGDSSSSPMSSKDECLDKSSDAQSEAEQKIKTTSPSEELRESTIQEKNGQLLRELELTQREVSRLQQLNRNLQDELQQQRDSWSSSQVDNRPNGSPEQTLALQQLQKMNHDLRSELEALKRSQEEAREAELRRRVDLLAQQAQLLVTGDATALAQVHMENDRRRFQEQRAEWERCVASLKSELSAAEEQRRDAESRFMQLQQEVRGYHSLQEEANRLQKNLQDMKTELETNEEAQAQKEARLQKHLLLLQESQDRERRSLAASLAQAEQHSHELQRRLDQAEEQVGNLSKTQTWTWEIERAQQQLQEELSRTVSAVQKLQEEREQLERHCEELQSQLSEADGEVSRLQSRLKTDETHYYNMEHSYERVCEELQVAVGKVKQKEADTQDIREGYERLLDRKEQELSEVLLKMEVLGNSLEETELRLNETMKVCTCASSRQKGESSEAQKQTTDPLRTTAADSGPQTRPLIVDPPHPSAGTAGDDPERFLSVIQALETKLYVTEEKLRDIKQRLEEQQGHTGCQDPHLCSQLTQSRATTQHLSLLLHSQAKQSQRFAQLTESRCRMLLGRFQVTLNIIQVCRERLQTTPINITEFERQLASAASCLQQGEKDAEKHVHESRNAGRGEDKILNDEGSAGSERRPSEDHEDSNGKCLMRELFVVEKMVSVLQSGKILSMPRQTEEDFTQRYRNITSQRTALKLKECENSEPLESTVHRACAEAELVYSALKLQQQYERETNTEREDARHQQRSLADINPPELAPYEGRGLGEAAGEHDESDVKKVEAEKEADAPERLIPRLQRRAGFLHQLCQETSDGDAPEGSVHTDMERPPAVDSSWVQEQVRMIYLSERLLLDFRHQREELMEKLQALCKEEETISQTEQEALNHSLSQLQEDNSALRKELERAELKIISIETGNQKLLENMQEIEDYHEERINRLEAEFQEKIKELQQIHEEEMKCLHSYYTKSCLFKEKQSNAEARTCSSPEQAVTERRTREELRGQTTGVHEADVGEVHQKDCDVLETPSDESFTALEEMHRQLIGDLQQQHQQEVAALLKEKDQLLQEETAATMAAIVAMRRAHKQELERSRRSQLIRESADITQLHTEYEKEVQELQKELEVLSVQHTQKCLENSQMSKELQEERQSLMQYQRENQELKRKQRQTDEMTQQYFSLDGKQPQVPSDGGDFYEMEVILRAREAEMMFLRQEARSLREELKMARMDKLYAQNKLKALYTNSPDELRDDVDKHCEDFSLSASSACRDAAAQRREDAVTNTDCAAFLKKPEKSSLTRQIRGVRSKSLKEGLSVQERLKLFDS